MRQYQPDFPIDIGHELLLSMTLELVAHLYLVDAVDIEQDLILGLRSLIEAERRLP